MTDNTLDHDTTIVITSCGRIWLLRRTIKSLATYIHLDRYTKIITEDTTDPDLIAQMQAGKFDFLSWWKIIYTGDSSITDPFASHYQALESLYTHITTSYVFHCEDDRIFDWSYEWDLLEDSKEILEQDPSIGIVLYRDYTQRTSYNILQSQSIIYDERFTGEAKQYKNHRYQILKNRTHDPYSEVAAYNGFTLNPGLRRTVQMQKIMFGDARTVDEKKMWERYLNTWLQSICITPGICRHYGWWRRSTSIWKDGILGSLWRVSKNAIIYYSSHLSQFLTPSK